MDLRRIREFTVINNCGLDLVEGRAPEGGVALDLPSRFVFVVLLMVLCATLAYAGNPLPDSRPDPGASYGTFRLAHDSWGKHMVLFGSESHYAWTDHSLGSFGLYQYFRYNRKNSKWKAFERTLALGILWEIKDGFVPYEKYGKIGGEGFSKKDVIRDLTGICSAVAWNYFMEKRNKNHRGK